MRTNKKTNKRVLFLRLNLGLIESVNNAPIEYYEWGPNKQTVLKKAYPNPVTGLYDSLNETDDASEESEGDGEYVDLLEHSDDNKHAEKKNTEEKKEKDKYFGVTDPAAREELDLFDEEIKYMTDPELQSTSGFDKFIEK